MSLFENIMNHTLMVVHGVVRTRLSSLTTAVIVTAIPVVSSLLAEAAFPHRTTSSEVPSPSICMVRLLYEAVSTSSPTSNKSPWMLKHLFWGDPLASATVTSGGVMKRSTASLLTSK